MNEALKIAYAPETKLLYNKYLLILEKSKMANENISLFKNHEKNACHHREGNEFKT